MLANSIALNPLEEASISIGISLIISATLVPVPSKATPAEIKVPLTDLNILAIFFWMEGSNFSNAVSVLELLRKPNQLDDLVRVLTNWSNWPMPSLIESKVPLILIPWSSIVV